MPTWADAQDFLRERFPSERALARAAQPALGAPDDDHVLLFRLHFCDDRTDLQAVEIWHETWEDESWLVACTELCPVDALAAVDALIIGGTLRVGALCLDGGLPVGVLALPAQSLGLPPRYVVRRAWALRNLHLDDLARELRLLALETMAARTFARPLLPPPNALRPTVAGVQPDDCNGL